MDFNEVTIVNTMDSQQPVCCNTRHQQAFQQSRCEHTSSLQGTFAYRVPEDGINLFDASSHLFAVTIANNYNYNLKTAIVKVPHMLKPA